MCYRYHFAPKDEKEVAKRFGLKDDLPELQMQFNISPTAKMPVITVEKPETLDVLTWGLTAPWDKSGEKVIANVRSETAGIKNMFKNAFQTQRCIVPATGFFEWRQEGDHKQPYNFQPREGKFFGFAGIYSEGNYAILTMEPNSKVKEIHKRMPVILKPEFEDDWLNPDISENQKIEELLETYPAEDMFSFPVSPKINNPLSKGPGLIQKQ